MSSGMVTVRDKSTGQEFACWPVDAREMFRVGSHEPADTPAAKVADGAVLEPFVGNAKSVKQAFPDPAHPMATLRDIEKPKLSAKPKKAD